MIINLMTVSNNIMFFLNFIILFYNNFKLTSQSINDSDKFTVVIDAGHGGKDPGAVSNGYYEKIIALNISLKLGKCFKIKVLMLFILEKEMYLSIFLKEQILQTNLMLNFSFNSL